MTEVYFPNLQPDTIEPLTFHDARIGPLQDYHFGVRRFCSWYPNPEFLSGNVLSQFKFRLAGQSIFTATNFYGQIDYDSRKHCKRYRAQIVYGCIQIAPDNVPDNLMFAIKVTPENERYTFPAVDNLWFGFSDWRENGKFEQDRSHYQTILTTISRFAEYRYSDSNVKLLLTWLLRDDAHNMQALKSDPFRIEKLYPGLVGRNGI